MLSKFLFPLGILICSISGYGQDTIQTSYQQFQEAEATSGIYMVNDIFHEGYKISTVNHLMEAYVLIEGEKMKLDTSIYVGEWSSDQPKNIEQAFSYYSKHIHSPPHSGESNFAVVSFVVNKNGELVSIRILEDLKNRLCEGEWEVTLQKDYGFDPFVIDGKAYVVEYIVKILDIGYCVPTLERSGGVKTH